MCVLLCYCSLTHASSSTDMPSRVVPVLVDSLYNSTDVSTTCHVGHDLSEVKGQADQRSLWC